MKDLLRSLICELINHGADEMTIRSVVMGLEADDDSVMEDNFKRMILWLQSVKNPTRNDIMVKVFLITDEDTTK